MRDIDAAVVATIITTTTRADGITKMAIFGTVTVGAYAQSTTTTTITITITTNANELIDGVPVSLLLALRPVWVPGTGPDAAPAIVSAATQRLKHRALI